MVLPITRIFDWSTGTCKKNQKKPGHFLLRENASRALFPVHGVSYLRGYPALILVEGEGKEGVPYTGPAGEGKGIPLT